MNNLYNQLNPQQNQIPNSLKSIISLAKNNGNPMALIQSLTAQNPQLGQLFNQLQSGNVSPKQLFLQTAKNQGVNPDSIISMLK